VIGRPLYNEADTRAKLIDPDLHAAGWDESRISREHYFTKGQIYLVGDKARRKQPLKADYLLRYNDALPLAVVEAKEEKLAPTAGMQQSKLYAQQLGLLFAYSSNGRGIEEFDFSTQAQRSLDAFPSPDELYDRYTAANHAAANAPSGRQVATTPVGATYLDPLVAPYYDRDGKRPRYYQEIAVNKALGAIVGGQRRVLLTMATGTGKTYMALQIAWKLTRAGRARRILFLADRVTLRDQAYNAFAAFEDARAVIDAGKAPASRDVLFAIYQGLYAGTAPESAGGDMRRVYERYPRDFFDLIIVDEAHRSGFGTWKAILTHFESAVHLGMTATPKRADNVDTYAYFGEPVYSYSLSQGIRDGFLATYKVHRVQTNVDKNGVTLADAKEQGAEVFVPPDAAPRDRYDQGQFEREITLPDRTRLICAHLANLLDAGDPTQKTIVFCVNQEHAADVAKHLQNHFGPRLGLPDYAVRIVAEDHDAAELTEQFQDGDRRSPVVATRVDLLSTGVDIPSLRNVVFLRPIASPVVFKQIIGRGSRVDEGADKLWFRIVDYTNATRLFDAWEEVATPAPPEPAGPADYYLTGLVLDQDTERPVAGATVLVESGPNTTEQYRTTRTGAFGCKELPRTGVTVIVTARGYRRRQITCPTSAGPGLVVAITLVPHKESGGQVIAVKGLTITVEDETYLELDGSGQRLTVQEYINRAKAEVFQHAADEAMLRALWLDPAKRKELLATLLVVNVSPEAIAALLHHPDADAYDVLASVAFGREPVSRDDRAAAFATRNGDFVNSYPPAAREVLLALLDKYRLGGVDELEKSDVLRTAPFDRMGFAPGVLRRFGDAARYRSAVQNLTRRLYEA